ncbi:MAG TPA: M20/M25/M40 family metallo-hydrolase [Vicinamibacterales bacterium]|nr:M20/M25/M40 family metallo-hydrolase [Vicinamibacterales bacterium]
MRRYLISFAAAAACAATLHSQTPIDWKALEPETLRHFQALVKIDTTSPPGNETRAVDYLKQVLDKEGIPYQVFAKDTTRANLVVRIKGNGKKKPILVMGHTDVVSVDPKKWVDHGPFSADMAGGYIYGRGTIDDKDNLTAGLMLVLLLHRTHPALDRDVIFLAESGEEGAPDVGAQFMVDQHFDAIDAEYCLAEGGGVTRRGGKYVKGDTSTTEKEPRPVELISRGPAGHGSIPRDANAVAHLTHAVDKVVAWTPELRINETTGSYFRKLAASAATPEAAQRYRDLISPDPKKSKPAAEWMLHNEPEHWSMTHTSLVPTIITAGYRYNVIPSEAKATFDVRLHPDEDQAKFLDQIRSVINDPTIEVRWARDPYRPAGASRLDTELYKALESEMKAQYGVDLYPTMSTGASDKAQIRSKGVQCYGVGPAIDNEDGAKGYGAHSDQERILEAELHRFVKFQYDLVMDVARAR